MSRALPPLSMTERPYHELLKRMRDAFAAPVSDRKHDAYFVFSILRALDEVDDLKSEVPLLGRPRALDYAAAERAELNEEGRSVEEVAHVLVGQLEGMPIWGHPRTQINVAGLRATGRNQQDRQHCRHQQSGEGRDEGAGDDAPRMPRHSCRVEPHPGTLDLPDGWSFFRDDLITLTAGFSSAMIRRVPTPRYRSPRAGLQSQSLVDILPLLPRMRTRMGLSLSSLNFRR